MFGAVFVAEAQSLIPCTGPDCNFEKFIQLIQNVIDFLLVSIAVPLAMILFAYAGWLYMSASGDPGKITQGHTIFKNVLIGLVIALAAWLVVSTISKALLDRPLFDKGFFFLKQSTVEYKVLGVSH